MGFFDRYPYTNWHNVNLDWVLERVKEWGQMVEANDQAFKDLEEANASFKEYVTNYLQDLDIQAQIDDKLDRMFESGELTEYLQPYVSDTVTDWLEEHITEPVGIVIDSSLTVAGAAADAKATGDRIEKEGLSNTAKNALLACFDHVGWSDDEGIIYFNALKSALNIDPRPVWVKNIGFNGANGEEIRNTDTEESNYPRAAYISETGTPHSLYWDGTTEESGYYPIPLPEGATAINIGSTGDGFVSVYNIYYDESTNVWTRINSSGWQTEYTFLIDQNATHYAASMKHGAAGTEQITNADIAAVSIEIV